MELKLSTRQEWPLKNVYGLIPGESDEYVIAIAHLDAFYDGANDNATGLAALLAWARHFSQREEQPGRNILLVATAGHHAGSPGTERLISEHRDRLDKSVLVLNCEHLASTVMARYSTFRATIGRRGEPRAAHSTAAEGLMPVNTENPRTVSISTWSPFLVDLMREAIHRYGLVVSMLTDNRLLGDSYPFALHARDVPVINFIEGAYWYHTSADTIESVSPQGMERSVRAFTYIIDRVAEAPTEELSRK
jgi:Zn-dependent M28 family amino/carboxypeptidase